MKKKQSKGKKKETIDTEITDERFRAAADRPQFRKQKDDTSKVVLDERFSSVLTDPRFQLQEKDKYGRKKKKMEAAAAESELSAFYTVEKDKGEQRREEDNVSASDENAEEPIEKPKNDDSDDEDDDQNQDPASRIAYLTALSRGELDVSSSDSEEDDDDASDDSSDSDDDSQNDKDEAIYGKIGILDPSHSKGEEAIVLTEEATPFMAVTNMDWENTRAVDLFAILTSFTPPGSVKRVRIFPSNFGIERMAQDALYGPVDLWKRKEKKENAVSDQESAPESSESDDEESIDDGAAQAEFPQLKIENEHVDSDFDPEKLRAYEAAKLRYFFAVVEFASEEYADVAYREVDGLELEHSSAALDMRAIPLEGLDEITKDRKLRDEATSLPSNYKPPDFVVSALQQTSVKCTWEDGDAEREQALTRYGVGQSNRWGSEAETDDLRAYLASDHSSDEEDSEDADVGVSDKGSNLRKMLGLDSDNENDQDAESAESESSDEEDDNAFSKQVTFVPGKGKLEEKIRSKLEARKDGTEELTPWQKYQLKRKEKKRERRQARRNKRSNDVDDRSSPAENDLMYESDPEFGKAEFGEDEDNFFVEQDEQDAQIDSRSAIARADEAGASERVPSTKEELELLLAGDNDEEATKDYDMRGLQRLNKNKAKKLRGARKRKEAERAANVSGTDFKLNTKDDRFAAVLDGADGRFGIDPTDPNFKETAAMREILSEQTKRRKAKKRAKRSSEKIAPNVSAESVGNSTGGAAALSSLVMSLKSKVAKRSQ